MPEIPTDDASAAAEHAMPAEFGTATGVFVVVSSMVGVGILTTSGYTVLGTGSNFAMIMLWALGGVVALCGALTIAELAAALPKSGGDYVYLHEAFGPLPAFLSGWVSFLLGFAGPIAVASLTASEYFLKAAGAATGGGVVTPARLATILVLVFGVIHTRPRSGTVRVQAAVTMIKLGFLIAFAVGGIVLGAPRYENLLDPPTLEPKLVPTMLLSLVYISYGYTGWNAASYIAGEIRDPGRRLPRAILIGTGLVTALYLALNTAYALALSAADIAKIAQRPGPDPLASFARDAAEVLFGTRVAGIFGVMIGLILLSTVSAYVLTGPRVLHAMAVAGHFPRFAARLSKRSKTPALATWLQVGWSIFLVHAVGKIDDILKYASVGLALFSMLAIASIFALRVRRPDLVRPFRTPGYPWTPAFYLLVTGALTCEAFLSQSSKTPSLYALGSILLGVPFYYLLFRGRPPVSTTSTPIPPDVGA